MKHIKQPHIKQTNSAKGVANFGKTRRFTLRNRLSLPHNPQRPVLVFQVEPGTYIELPWKTKGCRFGNRGGTQNG